MTRKEEIAKAMPYRLSAKINDMMEGEQIGFIKGALWADDHPKSDLFTKDQVIELIKDYFGANAISEPDLSLYIGAVIEQREFSK